MKISEKRLPGGRAADVRPFYVMDLLARARQMELEGRPVLHLEVGEPDFPTPQPIIDAGITALRRLKTHYTPATGLPELRQAIADHYLHRFDLAIDAHRIIVTPGASGALQLALSALVDTGDNVLLTDPGYPCNRNMIRLLGADSTVVPVNAETQYQMHASHIAEYWNEQSVAAMIASPSNPTGTMIEQQELIQLIEAVANAGGHLIVDEIYQGLVYTGDQHTALAYSNDVFVASWLDGCTRGLCRCRRPGRTEPLSCSFHDCPACSPVRIRARHHGYPGKAGIDVQGAAGLPVAGNSRDGF